MFKLRIWIRVTATDTPQILWDKMYNPAYSILNEDTDPQPPQKKDILKVQTVILNAVGCKTSAREGECKYAKEHRRAQRGKRARQRKNGKRSGSEKGVFWKRGLFRKVYFLEILENLEILEILENPQTVEKKGESDREFRDSRDFGDFRDSRDSSSEKTLFVMTPFSGPETGLI